MTPDPARGVFETLLVLEGRPVELEAHLARMRRSLDALFGAPLPADARALVLERARDARLGRLRMAVGRDLTCEVRVAPVPNEQLFPSRDRGPRLERLEVPGGLGAHKWADRRLLDAAQARMGPNSLPLLVDADGSALEASRANVFVVVGGAVVTPPADGRILPGITRGRVLALAAKAGLAVSYEELLSADEAFLTGAVRGIETVRGCDGRELPEGPIAPLLAEALRRLWAIPSRLAPPAARSEAGD
jgi:para-aminobenzoate synthetase/4-amino-4-deoxychorismate lyase